MADSNEYLTYIVNAVDNASGVFTNIGGAIGGLAEIASGVAVAAITALSAAITASVSATVTWGNKLDNISDVLGTTAKQSAGLDFAIESVGGNVDQFVGQLAFMEKGLFTASGKIGNTGKVIQSLGINVKNFSALDATQQAQIIADAFGKMPDGLKKTELMMGVFGRSGKFLSDTLNGLANGGMATATKNVNAYGLALTDQGVETTINFTKMLKQLELMARGVMVSLGNEFIPTIMRVGTAVMEFARGILPTVIARLHEFAEKAMGVGKEIMEFAHGALPTVITRLHEFAEKAMDVWGSIVTFARAVMPTVIARLHEFMQKAIDAWGAIVSFARGAIPTVIAWLHEFVKKAEEVGGAIVAFARGAIPTAIAGLREFVQKVVDVADAIIAFARDAIPTAIARFHEFALKAIEVGRTIIAFARDTIPVVVARVREFAQAFLSVATPAFNTFKEITADVIALFLKYWPGVSSTVGAAIGTITRAIYEHIPTWKQFKDKVSEVMDLIAHIVERAETAVIMSFWRMRAYVESSDVFRYAKLQAAFLVDWFNKNWPLMQETFAAVWKFIEPILNRLWPKSLKETELAWKILKVVISDVLDAITSTIRTAMLILTGHWSDAMNEIEDRSGRMVNRIKALFGINSPSSVFADIGKNLMLGLEKGVNDFSSAPRGALQRITGGMIQSAGGSVANNYNLTINSNATSENVSQSYTMMKALA